MKATGAKVYLMGKGNKHMATALIIKEILLMELKMMRMVYIDLPMEKYIKELFKMDTWKEMANCICLEGRARMLANSQGILLWVMEL